MEDLTGRTFTKVDLDENGAPIHPTLLLHVPYAQDEKNPETAASRLLTSIIDNDPEAQAILFHDPSQGAERIASMARRPHQIVAYRAGYLPEEGARSRTQSGPGTCAEWPQPRPWRSE